MTETYTVTMAVKVIKDTSKETVADEQFFFNNRSFADMANRADKFYELITALQKIK